VTEMWKESVTRVVFQTKVKEAWGVAISNAAVEFFRTSPEEGRGREDPRTPRPEERRVSSASPGPAHQRRRLHRHRGFMSRAIPSSCSKIGKVFVFKADEPESAWTVDVKNGKGGVQKGASARDATLELTDADFLAMTSGKAGGDEASTWRQAEDRRGRHGPSQSSASCIDRFQRGARRDREAARRSAPTPTPATPANSGDSGDSTLGFSRSFAPAIFRPSRCRLAKRPDLSKEIGATIQFNVKECRRGHRGLVVHMTGAGGVRQGTDAKATTTLRIDDAELAGLCKDPGRARDLYQHGKAEGRRRCSRRP